MISLKRKTVASTCNENPHKNNDIDGQTIISASD